METNESQKLSNSSVRNKRRRRRPRNRRNRKQDNIQRNNQRNQHDNSQEEDEVKQQQQELSLTELTSEAHALEKQLAELQTQLKINYSNIPSKEQGRVANAIAAEQISTTEEEINYVRSSLRNTYRRIFTVDLMYVMRHHIEDKLWKYIFYARIEEIRSKLKRTKSPEEIKALQKALYHRIDGAFQFYIDLNRTIKSTYHIDTKILGIELFNCTTTIDEKIGVLLQSNYICMGDLARYQAQQAVASNNKKKAIDCWSLSKTCYSKAIEVYRRSGKPYSQLALVSISNGNAMDVVWYYCMSLAVKYPSSVGRDNLRSFYQKIRFNSKPKDEKNPTGMISSYVESFLHMHQTVMFNQESSPNFSNTLPIASQLGSTLSMIVLSVSAEEDLKPTVSLLHILRTTLTRSIAILLISIWIMSDRLKEKSNYNLRPTILASQIHLYTFAFNLLNGVYRSSSQALEQIKDTLDPKRYSKLATYVDEALSPGLSIWCTFLYTNMTALSQYSMTAMTDTRNKEPEKKTLVKSIQSLLSHLINHPSFPDPVLNVLPITYPMSEDLLLLGVSALEPFHAQVDFFKEAVYDVVDEKSPEARKQVRWGRIRSMFKKMADSSSFDFIQYNQAEQKYSIIDENAKRQQQNRFMKALATQRLMEQVSSLEKNVNRMTIQQQKGNEKTKKQVYTCVVDTTAFLDSLGKVKKWASQTLNVNTRTQSSVLEVIVPLDVIDALDQYKKGTSHTNMQARESIRYLDQKLLENANRTEEVLTTSFLRTQKVSEKLNEWSDAQRFWIGEESRSNVVDQLLSDSSVDEDQENSDDDDSSVTSNEDLLVPRRRRNESDIEEDSEEEDSEEDDDAEEEDSEEEEGSEVDEEYNYEEDFAEEDEDIPYTLEDVPKIYRPILSCLLYYHSQQETTGEQPERLVLVTNDEDLAWWAELFGDPKTRKRLLIKSVNEWDQMVNQLDFEKVYDYTWRKQ